MKYIYLTLLSVLSLPLFSQDIIVLVNKKEIPCHVLEINTTEVKYNKTGDTGGVIYAMDISLVEEVRFANGAIHKVPKENTMDNEILYLNNRKNAIKADMFSPLLGFTSLVYEKSLKPGRSMEVGLGIIGVGINSSSIRNHGMYFKAGYKFLRTPDHYQRNMQYAHILKGAYARPDIIFGKYSRDEKNWYGPVKRTVTYGAITINLGKQLVFDNIFILDYYVGAGYGFATSKIKGTGTVTPSTESSGGTGYGVLNAGSGLAFSGGFRIGFLLK